MKTQIMVALVALIFLAIAAYAYFGRSLSYGSNPRLDRMKLISNVILSSTKNGEYPKDLAEISALTSEISDFALEHHLDIEKAFTYRRPKLNSPYDEIIFEESTLVFPAPAHRYSIRKDGSVFIVRP